MRAGASSAPRRAGCWQTPRCEGKERQAGLNSEVTAVWSERGSGWRPAAAPSKPGKVEFPRLASPELPTTIGRYEVVSRLGQGGMGSLYLAKDPKIGRLRKIGGQWKMLVPTTAMPKAGSQ